MNILIAGASGFIGKNLVQHLKQAHQVQCLSLRDDDWLSQIYQPDVFINLVGKAHDHKGAVGKSEYNYVNLELTKKLFRSFQDSQATTFIHFSSLAAVEEIGSPRVIDDKSVANPISFYGKSKRAAEEYLLSQSLPATKKLIILRPTMVHGPGDKGNLTLLFKFVNYGVPYPLGAFENERSFLGIDNLCFLIGKILIKRIPNGVYHLADDHPLSTRQIVEIIASINNKKVRIMKIPKGMINTLAKIGDLLKLPLNTKRLKKLTGNLVVSNDKIKKNLNLDLLPYTAEEGMIKTINSFLNK